MLLLDRADFPRDKSCGDGIAPHVLDALGERRSGGRGRGVDAAAPPRARPGDTRVAGPMAREVYVVPREVFDARLVEHAVRRARCCGGAGCAGSRSGTTGVVLDGEVAARVVVGADGVHSVLRPHLLGARGSRGRSRSAATRRPRPSRRARQVIRYGPRAQPAYAWAFDRGDGWSNVGYGELLPGRPARRAPPSRALLLEQLEAAAARHGARGHRLERPPPAAVGVALAAARRAGAAGR